MKGRAAPLRIWSVEQPELSDEVKIRLERDRLHFLDQSNIIRFIRPYVPGEAEPYKPGIEGASVEVHRDGKRIFFSGGVCVLVIDVPFEPVKKKPSSDKRVLIVSDEPYNPADSYPIKSMTE